MRGGQTALNSGDFQDHKLRNCSKTCRNAKCPWETKSIWTTFWTPFFTKLSTFLMLWLLGILTQVATSRPCRARCI